MNHKWIEYNAAIASSRPVVGKAVLVTSPVDGIGIAALEDRHGRLKWCWLYKRVNDSMLVLNVTHWMPLPAPPTGDGGAE